MRRIIAGVLLATLLAQVSGGTALASDSGATDFHWVGGSLAVATAPLQHAWLNSALHALFTGQMARYDAMHAAALPVPKVPRNLAKANLRDLQRLHPSTRQGFRVRVPGFTRVEAVDPRKAPHDPLAMRKSAKAGTVLSFATRWNARGRFAMSTAAASSSQILSSSVSPQICIAPCTGCPPLCISPSPRPTATPTPRPTPTPSPTPTPAPTATPTPTPAPEITPGTTGVNAYWAYEQHALPGVGTAAVNVGTGNVIAQSTDVAVSERGVDLSFTRSYNSQSQHDANDTDDSTPSVFGNGWTNTYDLHLAYNAEYNIISVYDADGARYDYTADGNGNWIPPGGQFAQLTYDGSCGYDWTQKDGSNYHFEAPMQQPSGCGSQIPQGLQGRLIAIAGRNANNNATLAYSWTTSDPNGNNPEDLTQILVQHSDGQTLTLTFGPVGENGSGPTELSSVTRPDGQQITYAYDSSGDLTSVAKPGNNAAATLTQAYDYTNGQYLLTDVYSPRYMLASGADGGYVTFSYDSSRRATQIVDSALVNFTPSDGTSTPLQSASQYPTGVQPFRTTQFSGFGSGTTDVVDSDGHERQWTTDGDARPTQLQAYTGSIWLLTQASWDANNDLTSVTNPQSNVTTYSYDGNGNLTEVVQPQTSTADGTINPTTAYVYDGNNNLLVACDAVYMSSHSSCTASSGATYFTWNTSDSSEPYGYITDMHSPLGYHTTVSYNESNEGGDYGLATDIVGAAFTQEDDTQAQPQVHVTYDAYGNVTSQSQGYGSATATYDVLQRVASVTDADGVTTRACYNLDSSISQLQSARQYALDGTLCGSNSEQYTYDADGDQVSQTSHYNGETGTTQYWYDGVDRMVEALQPSDGTIDGGQAGLTRYLYDLSEDGSSLQVAGSAPFAAHGNVFKTQRCNWPTWPTPPCSWSDISGQGYDQDDRETTRYAFQPFGSIQTWTIAYDQNGYTGMPTSQTDPLAITTTAAYLATGWLESLEFSDGVTPARVYGYDADGRVTEASTEVNNTEDAEMYSYDAQGDVLAHQDGAAVTSPASLSYGYYPNGWRESMTATASALTGGSEVFSYAYRSDGLRTKLGVSGYSNPFAWTYTDAGRALTQSDPYTGEKLAANGLVSAGSLQAMTYTYDSYGELSSQTFPSGTYYDNMTYDPEGEITGYEIGMAGFSGDNSPSYATSAAFSYNIRGELTQEKFKSDGGSETPVNQTYEYDAPDIGNPIDPNTGVMGPTSSECPGTGPFFDADGRFINCISPSDDVSQLTYDAQNRFTLANGCVGSGCVEDAYGWDANGILQTYTFGEGPSGDSCQDGLTCSTYSLHWDGNQLLFVSGPDGGLKQLNVEQIAEQPCKTSSQGLCVLDVIDRDFTGYEVDLHNGGNAGGSTEGTNTAPSYYSMDGSTISGAVYGQYPPAGLDSNPINLVEDAPYTSFRTDGYQVGPYTFQGARVVNPITGQWTSSDQDSGALATPLSERGYAWVGNNPIEKADPTGYLTSSVYECPDGSLHSTQVKCSDGSTAQPLPVIARAGTSSIPLSWVWPLLACGALCDEFDIAALLVGCGARCVLQVSVTVQDQSVNLTVNACGGGSLSTSDTLSSDTAGASGSIMGGYVSGNSSYSGPTNDVTFGEELSGGVSEAANWSSTTFLVGFGAGLSVSHTAPVKSWSGYC